MNDSIWQKIAETPWWQIAIVGYMIYLTYLTTKPRTISLRSLQFSVGSMLALSLIGLTSATYFNTEALGRSLVMFLLGSGLGWLQFSRYRLQAIAGEKKLVVPGSRTLIFLIPTIVFLKYYFHGQLSLDASTLPIEKLTTLFMTIVGLTCGLFTGRLFYATRIVKVGPFVAAQN
jgi:hypothetical protein